eukprot:m.935166 g.935166  ORF g.935166 m.935166 type:complete len:75 (+) comp23803_c0_seq6:7590-7814(+)
MCIINVVVTESVQMMGLNVRCSARIKKTATELPGLECLFVQCSDFAIESSVECTQQMHIVLFCCIVTLLYFGYF